MPLPGEAAGRQGRRAPVGRLFDPNVRLMRKAWVFVLVLGHSLFSRVKVRVDLDKAKGLW